MISSEAAMDEWQQIFRERMRRFESEARAHPGEIAVSIKVRITSGCFHREHSPRAYQIIDSRLAQLGPESKLAFVEHESGPELLVYLAVTTAGLTLAKSIIELITTIIKARSEGVKKGDQPDEPVELIVRRVDNGDEFCEEMILRIGHKEPVEAKPIKKQLEAALRKLASKDQPSGKSARKHNKR
jgi:hypothetical protein